ncbi:MAG: ribonuclease R [Planctomycetes bacterium]|nr:ribonuclease R [Planctomycetota bacterium]
MVTPEEILTFLHVRRYKPVRWAELVRHFAVPEEQKAELEGLLRRLQEQGLVVCTGRGRLGLPKALDMLVGTLEVASNGSAFVIPIQDDGLGDVYVPSDECGTALHGDTVAVRLLKRGRRSAGARHRFGRVVRVIRRAHPTLVGLFQRGQKYSFLIPDNSRIPHDVVIAEEDSGGARPGDRVVVQLLDWTESHHRPEGVVIEVLGRSDDPAVDAPAVIRGLHLPDEFCRRALEEARAFGRRVTPDGMEGRIDLRSAGVVTVDPTTAHDFDDGVSLEERPGGGWRLGVHIADVSHYVRPETALDEEARTRGTSVYLPGRAIPMLPPELSSHLCSLIEGEDRLTKTVWIDLGPDAAASHVEIHRSVIRSARRLTYDQASEMLESSGHGGPDASLAALLKEMERVALALHRRRMKQGALELDIPEPELELAADGSVLRVRRRARKTSHRIIEEFMLAANEAVSQFCRRHRLPCMFRIHEEPDPAELEEFMDFLLPWGHVLPRPPDRFDFQEFLARIRDRPESYPVSLELLKSLRQAEYSAQSVPHYALAMDRYCHFTSPIRRYPDLLVHRILDDFFDGSLSTEKERHRLQALLEAVAGHCTLTERRADEAERELTCLKVLRYLEKRRGDRLPAMVVRLRPFGFFIELEDALIQGLVPLSRLTDDDYELDGRRHAFRGRITGRTYRLGDRLDVVVDRVDLYRRRVDFVPVSPAKPSRPKRDR